MRFFDLRFKKSPEGQKRLMAIRPGSGDADLVQDVSDLLLLCSEHAEALQKAPRSEADAAARLRELSPLLARMLADKTLSPEAQRSRKLRDAAYTLVVHAERRLRAAAEYAGTDKMKDYGPFPVSRGAASTGDEEEGEAFAEDGAHSLRYQVPTNALRHRIVFSHPKRRFVAISTPLTPCGSRTYRPRMRVVEPSLDVCVTLGGTAPSAEGVRAVPVAVPGPAGAPPSGREARRRGTRAS
ncbi:hypothetical protein WME75_39770 [Sorangium sp. So ce1014]|uniref:hypothetical protein n=1 Tax=Sorangium sp. So ce1014 TaxID=3133326 RepID=UPI003F5F2C10